MHEHGDPRTAGHGDARVSQQAPAEFWEQRYAGAEAVWSGKVNRSLAEIVSDWTPGRSLDLGCGEGGDVLWLAERGWDATGIDLSPTATGRARAAADSRGIAARFIATDLGEWASAPETVDGSAGPYDLVTASFLQSPVELPRKRILRAAAERVALGGRLVVISHAAAPGWAPDHPGDFPSPESELAALDLAPELWAIELAEVRAREAVGPDGVPTVLKDTLVVVRRLRDPGGAAVPR
ncbi:methyltransferase domain-containing protein [Leucobacter ruminantium]|uniref:Methyltransferase domain-containing protein n=1 Tax=Leucobacter ruminantium TaxID=1289170 RepID=A0A939RWH0_9MICO|nr:methyltransferase domain-containing protein [Leucobacter ruminantium]